jgi:hypothetical protein
MSSRPIARIDRKPLPVPVVNITELSAPSAAPRIGFRLWERAVLALSPLMAATPLVSCLVNGRAGWFGLALPLAVAPVAVVVRVTRRESTPAVPASAPGWHAAWSDREAVTVTVEREAA